MSAMSRVLKISNILLFVLIQLTAAQELPVSGDPPKREGQQSVSPGNADGASSLDRDEMGNRRPLYRLQQSDIIEISFGFSPEFNQTVTVRPDGFVSLQDLPDLYVSGLTVAEFRHALMRGYSPILHQPAITVTVKDFEKPYFIAGGQVARPGKYELRGPVTATEALAIAGGLTEQSKHSQVILFRKHSDEQVQATLLNVKQMLNSRDLRDDLQIKPGDLLFVPQNRISKIRKFLPVANLSTYVNPTQF